ncbi:MAG: hypothetical protein IIC67_01335 [Thaumarchaeota archaeon]|nr:hypothetical protein [Nitrososphaerota archaeon]
MGAYWIPLSIPSQLQTVQLLQKVPFIPQEQRRFLFDIEKTLKRNIRLTENEKQKLQEILTKFGFRIQLSN